MAFVHDIIRNSTRDQPQLHRPLALPPSIARHATRLACAAADACAGDDKRIHARVEELVEEGSQNRCLEARAQLADDENVFSAVDRGIRKVNLKGVCG